MFNRAIFYLTSPLRLFGRSGKFRLALGAVLVLVLFFAGALWALNTFWPIADSRPVLAAMPPLPPATRASIISAPVAVALPAIRTALDNAAPRNFGGKADNPVASILSKADIGVTVARGSITVTGANDAMTINTPFTGTLHITGQIGGIAGNVAGGVTSGVTGVVGGVVGGALGGVLGNAGSNVGRGVQNLGKALDQSVALRGAVVMVARPALTPAWRLDPNLTASVSMGDSNLSIAGARINAGSEAKPFVDKQVAEQVAALQARLRNDPTIERTAREQWAKMCRALPLGGGATGLPALWLELKPKRAFAGQPRIDATALTITVGVEADTRISPSETKPDCPFPAQLEILPRGEQGKLAIGVPIDVPFKDLNKLLEAQLKGKTFPQDKAAPVEVEVRAASLAAANNQLLIALRVKAHEKKSWFGLGAEVNVYVWGKPVLDTQTQILRLTDLSLAVESEAAFGLLGAAARAAMPYLQQALADNAVLDLKPFAADAKTKIAGALAEFQQDSKDVKVDAAIDDLRLTGIEFDSTTLRVIAEATGAARVAVTQLPAR